MMPNFQTYPITRIPTNYSSLAPNMETVHSEVDIIHLADTALRRDDAA
jgi:hypothetical protein